MPVYKITLPVVSFSATRPLPSLRRPRPGIIVQACDPGRHTALPQSSWADDGQTPPSAGKPFG